MAVKMPPTKASTRVKASSCLRARFGAKFILVDIMEIAAFLVPESLFLSAYRLGPFTDINTVGRSTFAGGSLP
jgi:hypothetical protein